MKKKPTEQDKNLNDSDLNPIAGGQMDSKDKPKGTDGKKNKEIPFPKKPLIPPDAGDGK